MKSEHESQIKALMEEIIEAEVERRIKEYPVYVKINGKMVDYDGIQYADGQIDIDIGEPIFFVNSEKAGYINMEMPRRLAV